MKKLLAILLMAAMLVCTVPAGAEDCEYSGFIKSLRAYTWFDGSYNKDLQGYFFSAMDTEHWVALLRDKSDKTLKLAIIYYEDRLLEIWDIDLQTGDSSVTVVIFTPFGMVPMIQAAFGKCETEKYLSARWKIVVNADFYTNVRIKDTGGL